MLPISFLKEVRQQAKEYSTLDDAALKELALDLGFEARQSERLKRLIVRGFAMVLVAAARKLEMTHYDVQLAGGKAMACLLYTSPSPRDLSTSRMPSSA